MDLNQTIPTINMVALAIAIFISIGVPIYVFLLSKRQFLGRWQTIFFGVADYLIIEFFLTNLVLFLPFLIPGFGDLTLKHPALYSILCVILLGAISEVGRYLALGMGLKEYSGIGTAAMFATGVATTRSLLLITWNAVQSLLICMTVNQTGLASLAEAAGDEAETILSTLSPLFSTSSLTYFASGLDVVANFVLHFSMTMIFFAVITRNAPKQLIVIAAGLRALYELPTYLFSYEVLIPSAFAAEILVVIITAVIGWLGWTVAHKYCKEDIDKLHLDSYSSGKNKSTPFPKFNENIKK